MNLICCFKGHTYNETLVVNTESMMVFKHKYCTRCNKTFKYVVQPKIKVYKY